MKYIANILLLSVGIAWGLAIGSIGIKTDAYQNIKANRLTKTFRCTAYCPCEKCCNQFADGITASGHKIKPGDVFVAAAKGIPFGTMLTIPGYNEGKPVPVLDRGGAICEGRLDVFFGTHQTAKEWGVQYLEVTIEE